MKFNEKLRDKRLEAGLTQEDLAYKLNISRQSVSKWESGINEPDIQTLKKLSIILNVSLDELIDDDGETKNTKDERKEKAVKVFKYVSIGLGIFGTILILGLISLMPSRVPVHFDIKFKPDQYGSKYTYLIPTLIILVIMLPNILVKNKEKYKDFIKQRFTYHLTLMICQILVTLMMVFIAFLAVELKEEDASKVSLFVVCALLMGMGPFTHPYFNKRNSVFGFRSLLTLTNEEVWIKVNTLMAYLGTSGALLAFVLGLFVPSEYSVYLIFIILASLIPAFIYHEILRGKVNKE